MQPEYQKYGTMARTTVHGYRPKYVLLAGKTPLNQCLCDYCENCELLMKALTAVGVQGIAANKYTAVNQTLCPQREEQFGTHYQFARHDWVMRNCGLCGKAKMMVILDLNKEMLNKSIKWHKWKTLEGKTAPQKVEIKGSIRNAINDYVTVVDNISDHLFRANWNRNVFDYIKGNLKPRYVLQVMDFAMNFNNWYQDEVQSAYWTGTQTTIHATMNFFKCSRCDKIVSLALVHISADMKHDSFLSRAAQNMTFKFLAELGIPLDLEIQFSDNCASQYKSRRPFVELAKSPIDIICVYFGEKHGKSHADGLFGQLKA